MQKSMYQAAGEFGGLTAAAVLCVLAKEFGVFVDEMALCSEIGISIPETDEAGMDGAAQTAYAGVGQFMAVTARLKGLSREETLLLCGKWKQCFQDWKMQSARRNKPAAEEAQTPEDWFLDILMLAYDFIGSRRELLGLGDKVAKPQKYYDSIYEDRESMFQHSPYALEVELTKAVAKGDSRKALKALRKITAQGKSRIGKRPASFRPKFHDRIYCVFGKGGDPGGGQCRPCVFF